MATFYYSDKVNLSYKVNLSKGPCGYRAEPSRVARYPQGKKVNLSLYPNVMKPEFKKRRMFHSDFMEMGLETSTL